MSFLKVAVFGILAASLVTVLAAPAPGASIGDEKSTIATRQFTSSAPGYYSGPYYDFPAMSNWVDFSTMFSNYEQYMVDAGSTWDDVGRIAVAIENAAADIGVDERVILGVIIQESSGYVGVTTTYDADGNPTGGLMQSEGCTGFDGENGLPQEDTSAMVYCGTEHYKANLEDWGNLWDISSIYPALREYNSGSVDTNDLSDAPNGIGNPYYVSDVSQRMEGYVF